MYKWIERMVLYVFPQKSSGLCAIQLAFGLCFFFFVLPEQRAGNPEPYIFSNVKYPGWPG